jgi:pimeloyl-ACP methyl ester carboxylesterase
MGDFVHGAGGSSSIWFKQDFKNSIMLLLDLRGHGESKTTKKQPLNKNIPFRL